MGPAAHSGPASFFPYTDRPCLGKTKRKEAVCCPASFSREELLEVEAITAPKVVASKPPASGACSPCEGKQAVRVMLLPLLQAELEQIEPTNSGLPPEGQGREPAALRG